MQLQLKEIYVQLLNVIINHRYVLCAANVAEEPMINLGALDLIALVEEEKRTIYSDFFKYIHSRVKSSRDFATLMFILSSIEFIEPILNKNQQLTETELDKLAKMLIVLVQTINELCHLNETVLLQIEYGGKSHSIPGFRQKNMPTTFTSIATFIVNALQVPLFTTVSTQLNEQVQSILKEYQGQATPAPLPIAPAPIAPPPPAVKKSWAEAVFDAMNNSSPIEQGTRKYPIAASQPKVYPSPLDAAQETIESASSTSPQKKECNIC